VLSVFDALVAPAAERFRPDIILVSAGFDAHWRDPFQQLQFRWGTRCVWGRRRGGGGWRQGRGLRADTVLAWAWTAALPYPGAPR
jgi:hypothetical protein